MRKKDGSISCLNSTYHPGIRVIGLGNHLEQESTSAPPPELSEIKKKMISVTLNDNQIWTQEIPITRRFAYYITFPLLMATMMYSVRNQIKKDEPMAFCHCLPSNEDDVLRTGSIVQCGLQTTCVLTGYWTLDIPWLQDRERYHSLTKNTPLE